MNVQILKKLMTKAIPYIGTFALFLLLTCVYAYPVFEGNDIHGGDYISWKGMVQEAMTSKDNGNPTWWTGSMFSGMPSYQIGGGQYLSSYVYDPLTKAMRYFITNDTIYYILNYFVCFFILFKSFRFKTGLSAVGSIAMTLSSYFFIIIAAGHNTKVETIALMAPVIGGFFLTFQKKYLWGALVTMLYVAVGFMKHPQMSYYYCMLIGCLGIAELYTHIKNKRLKDFGIGCAIFIGSMIVGLGVSYPKYKANMEYVSETMRGGHSELAKESDTENKTSGLDLDYATAWSYGIDETFTFLVPGFMGNASGYNVGTDSEVYDSMIKHGVSRSVAKDYSKQMPTYWGEQPFTAGPVYMGSIICFLFVLGLLIVKTPYKWALLVATLFSIFLSWGHNFMSLTEFFFKYFPMYSKFRAVSSILIIAEITMPLLGFLALKEIMESKIDKESALKNIYISAGITGGICLIFALFGGVIFDFSTSYDERNFQSFPEWMSEAIVADRVSMLKGDAFRSFIFIAIAVSSLYLYIKGKLKEGVFVAILGAAILIDMWQVDKRYLNDTCFISEKQAKNYFKKQPWEERLLSTETDMNYRVLNLTTNTFNESRTSYYFKSIGGYHAAKLRRYQDLIEQHISQSNWAVLNMLNTKYIITKNAKGEVVPQRNPNAMGNAWYVDSITVVNTPNEESDALRTIDLTKNAVTDAQFADFVSDNLTRDSLATVKEISYAPNKLEYQSESYKDGTIVFSEIYYPYGWKASIDGVEVPHFRVNYVLRALNVPAGRHKIEFVFDPDSVRSAQPIAYICYAILYGLIFFVFGKFIYDQLKKED